MKTKILAIVSASALAITTFVACNKNSNELKSNSESNLQTMSSGTFVNPFNYLGELHNTALNNIKNYSSFPNLTGDEKFNINVNTNLEALGNFEINYDYTTFREMVDFYNDETRNNVVLIPTFMYDAELIDTKTKDLLQSIFDNVFDYPNGRTPQEFNYAIYQIEEAIIQEFGIPNSNIFDSLDLKNDLDKSKFLLITCAIAKSSYSYWYNVSLNSNHEWFPSISNNGDNYQTMGGIWRWIKRAGADIGGFCGGGVSVEGGGSCDGDFSNCKGKVKVKISITKAIAGAEEASSKI